VHVLDQVTDFEALLEVDANIAAGGWIGDLGQRGHRNKNKHNRVTQLKNKKQKTKNTNQKG
jgi:hypothetical protein